MMRSLWIAISTLALANLLALGGFAMWLNSSGRLNKDRIEKVRQIFQPTIAQDVAKAAEEKGKEEAAAKEAEVAARDKRPPVTAEQRLAIIREHDETQRQKSERLQRETRDLLTQLDIKRAEFDKQKAEFVAERAAFDAERAQIARTETDTQMQKTLKVYESVKAADAAAMMETLLNGDGVVSPKQGRSQVVSYLNAMQPRVSSRIIGEFRKKDAALAADLLERLRTYGIEARADAGAKTAAAMQDGNDANDNGDDLGRLGGGGGGDAGKDAARNPQSPEPSGGAGGNGSGAKPAG